MGFLSLCLFACGGGQQVEQADCPIIPLPNEVKITGGSYTLQGETTISLPDGEAPLKVFRYLADALKNTAVSLKRVALTEQAAITFRTDSTMADEAYMLEVTADGITARSNATGAGLFYAVQSLLQLMPVEICNAAVQWKTPIEIPALSITDAPRFPHRGAMMDVGRNFLPKEEVLKFLDLMAVYKLNKFHFHLTDDQGWRIEIKKYPNLVEVGSRRSRTQIGHSDYYHPRRFDDKERHGYYTQEEIREIVAYAADRFITVIPEIEMPGHSSAALAAYPELSCGLGKTYVVRDYFDVFDEVYCPKENTFTFLEDVLTEVMELFPSHYIHIGGDECPKKAWKKCEHCQALMKREGLKDEEALQSRFIHRMERFVNSKGRDIIGWDEILEGGLAPNATVMSWRGEAGGIEAARQRHKVIMTPGDWCYFDHYQESPEFAPLAIGSFLPLDSVYGYNPLPSALNAEEQSYIIGTQANIWGEYIPTPEYFEYMAFPRLLAMAEVQWTQPRHKNFEKFSRRLDKEFGRLDRRGVNACRNFYEVHFAGAWNTNQNRYEVTLRTYAPDAEIYYSLSDSAVSPVASLRYGEPVELSADATLYAAAYRDGKPLGKVTRKSFAVNKATGVSYESRPVPEEKVNRGTGLTDGVRGYARDLRRWSIYDKDTVEVTIDLGREMPVTKVAFASLWRPYDRLWPVRGLEVLASSDRVAFTPVKSRAFNYDYTPTEATRFPVALSLPGTTARYLRLVFVSDAPYKGYYGEGNPSRIALDEIEIY